TGSSEKNILLIVNSHNQSHRIEHECYWGTCNKEYFSYVAVTRLDNIEYIQPSEPNVKKQGIIKKLVGDDAYSVDPKDKTHTI
ncbi:5439_t:CDS:2, partial [Entrophospora sp. SA101]